MAQVPQHVCYSTSTLPSGHTVFWPCHTIDNTVYAMHSQLIAEACSTNGALAAICM